MSLDLLDPRLFGNEAGDDEDEKTLASYFVEKPEFKSFESDARRLAICRARKGMGKSALLNYISYSKSLDNNNIVLRVKGQQLLESMGEYATTPHEWLASWRRALTDVLTAEVSASHRGRNKLPPSVFAPVQPPISPFDPTTLEGRLVWLCIDDIDATYRRSAAEDLRLSTFFSACRSLVTENANIRLRVSVRQDVWASIRAVDEALDKCEQYMLDIEWSRTGTRSILAKRIKHYLALMNSGGISVSSESLTDGAKNRFFCISDDRALGYIFPAQYPWGASTIEPFHVVHVFSAGRPRWALQLARMTAGIAVKYSDSQLKYGYMKQILPKYSQFRINDLIREHSHQCSEIENLIFAFGNADHEFTTAALLAFVDSRICRLIDVFIDREHDKSSALGVCHFLYRIGFLEAVDLTDTKIHRHFDDSPHLLRSITAVHDRIRWEIRASYRAALNAGNKVGDLI